MDDDEDCTPLNDDVDVILPTDSPSSSQGDDSTSAAEALGWVSPPSITVPVHRVQPSEQGYLEQPPSVLESCDIVEHEISPSPSCFSYSPGSVTSAATTPSSTRAGRSSSAATVVSDREIISRVWSSMQSPHEVQTLDLSTAMKKTRRALKSLGALSEFDNLTSLDVSNNAVADLHGLEAFVHLETLVLSRNHLKKIGPELFSLSSLRDLDLSGNFIAHIPRAVARLELLERLNVSGNSLSTLKEVDALSSLSNLHVCNFSANPFCKLPTYRDYVVFKLAGLETLDGMPITAPARDKARRRFFDAVFAKDAQLREAGEAHENEQSRLRDAQSALEAENLRLKGELQVKSQLLQNKSRAWSDATERLLQLQQEIAMLNLERQQQHAALMKDSQRSFAEYEDENVEIGRWSYAFARGGRSTSSPALGSPELSVRAKIADISGNTDAPRPGQGSRDHSSYHLSQRSSSAWNQTHTTGAPRNTSASPCSSPHSGGEFPSPSPSPHLIETSFQSSPVPLKPILMVTAPANSSLTVVTSADLPEVSVSTVKHPSPKRWNTTVPFWGITADGINDSIRAKNPIKDSIEARSQRSESFERVRRAFSAVAPGTAHTTESAEEIDLQDEEKVAGRYTRRLSQFPTVEDELACPAYEDTHALSYSPALASPAPSPLRTQPMRSRTTSGVNEQTTPFYRVMSSPGRLVSSPRYDVKSPSQRIWERQHRDFKDQVLSPPSKSPGEFGFLDAKSPNNKDVLIRQTQALQSCKHVLLKDIAKEEELLHALKQQGKQFATQIESLETNIQACIDATKADEQASLELPFSGSGGPHSPRSTARRRDDAVLAKLEVLRSKLLLMEDREKEIEMAMVRKTKRVLETDVAAMSASMGMSLGSVAVTDSAFDKEIFALANKLQLTIVQKEELQLEMARVMEMLRDQHRCPSVTEAVQSEGSQSAKPLGAGASPRRRGSRSDGAAVEGRTEKDPSLAQSYKLLAELRQKHQDVVDRIRVKEDLLASLVDELRDVEAELEHIGRVGVEQSASGGIASPARRPRSASFDFHQEARMLLRLGEGKSPLRGSNQISSQSMESVKPSTSTGQEHAQAIQLRGVATSEVPNDNTSKTVNASVVGDAVFPFKLQFKELLTAEMLEEIKNEVFAKLLEQFAALTSVIGGTPEGSAQQERQELHDAIAAALDAHMQLAMENYEKKKLAEGRPISGDCEADGSHDEDHGSGPTTRQNLSLHSGRSHPKQQEDAAVTAAAREEGDACWDHFAELSPMEAIYSMKYKFVKYHESLTRGSGPKSAASIAGTQRILKACERLDAARVECRTNPTTFIEVDPAGNSKSALKVLLMSARDLPTSHLRTKNLDPYVSLEIVYPDLKKKLISGGLDASAMTLTMQSFRSRTQKKTMYPVWDEEFDFSPVLSLNGYLHVRILNDRKISREQIVGETRIPLRTLLHQRRVVEWYSLGITVPSSSSSRMLSSRHSKVISKICGGAVRLQLQLSFSRVEKYKRIVDELVTKFLHEHNHLPPFIEPVDASREAGQEHPEQDDSDSSLPILGNGEGEQQHAQQQPQQQSWQSLSSVSSFPLSELEASLSVYGRWRMDVVDELLVSPNATQRLSKDPIAQYSPGEPKQLTTPAIYAGVMDSQSLVTDASLTLKANASRIPSEYFPPEHQEARTLLDPPPPDRQWGATNSRISRTDPHSKSPYARANQTMPVSHPRLDRRKSSSLPKSRPIKSTSDHNSLQQQHQFQQHPPFRPKPVSSSRRDECFDEYSPYHPAFQFVDLFDGGNNEFIAKRHRQSPTYSSTTRGPMNDRKTDLRIFKSPGFLRRQPSSGFPERYIGLDNQTCERLKRMFGRIDAAEAAARRPRPSR